MRQDLRVNRVGLANGAGKAVHLAGLTIATGKPAAANSLAAAIS